MSKFLVIAEKPSVAQSYAKNLSAYKREDGYLEGESCIVSWCLGHLAEYAQPEEYDPKYEKWQFDDLPILPEAWKLKVSKDKKKQFDVLKGLMNRSDVEYLVNGCDAGREGELIFQRVYDLAGCRKPVKRLWISSMEDAAIQKGFQTMKSEEEYKNLCMAAVCRAQADWLIGMNGTRAYTTRYFKRLVVGRVQTPTLAMLAERQERIEHFQKEAFYKVALTDGKLTVVSENIANEEAADLLAALCNGSTAVVTQMKKEDKKAFPPRLYDLTSLQREANRYFGYTAKRTLEMLQELYEEKLVTYPRTDSQFVTEDMKDSVEELVGKMPVLLSFVDYGQLGHGIKRVINNAKVSDHHAILPTKEAVEKGIADLPADKKNLMMLICQQLVQATGEEYLYEQTDITVKCQEQDFKARGKIPVQMGFKEVEKAFKQLCVKAEPVEGKEKETSIPAGYEEGMRLFPVKADKTTHYTSPPKPFNEDTLLAAMETAGNKEFDSETEKKGLGTPATRASIIEKLVSSGYAQRKGKQILPSTEGKELVKVMPEYLKSAVMTAEWENQLLMMEKGQITDTQFMGEITSLVRKILEVCREIPEEERRRFQTEREVIGKCPVCGCDVFEGKQNFYCSNRQCDFALWKENRFLGSMEKNLDKKMARELLDKACTHVKGLYSKKKDMKFDADLLLTLEDGKPRFHLEFPKKKKK
jgi:DNA topoisomerase-3